MQKEIRVVKVEDLKPFGGNPRHNNESAKVVAKSIEQFGYINPIVADENLVILAGNTRFKAMKLLGYEELDVLVVSGLTESQKNGFVIADNAAAQYSHWNMAALERMLENMELDIAGLAEFGILNIKDTKKKLMAHVLDDKRHQDPANPRKWNDWKEGEDLSLGEANVLKV